MIFQLPGLRNRFIASLAVWSFFAFSLTKLLEPTMAPHIVTFAVYLVMSVSFVSYFWLQYRYTLTFSEFVLSIVVYNFIFVILQFIYYWLFVIDRLQDWSWIPGLMISDFIFAGFFYLIFYLLKSKHRAK